MTDEVFDRVQAVLDGKALSVTLHVRSHPDFPLRYFVRCGECGTPLTASWSKGRTSHYSYYRCRASSCRAVNVTKAEFENEFLGYLSGLKPKPELMRLFKEIVLDVWKKKRADTGGTIKTLDRKLGELRQRKEQLVNAFTYRQAIDEATYQDQNDKLSEEITLAEMELHDARLDELDVEGVLNFAEHVMGNAPRMWMECSVEQKQRLQKVLFPGGVTYSKGTFGTTEVSSVFRVLQLVSSQNASKGSSVSKGAFGTAETAANSDHLAALDTPEMKGSVPDGI